MVAMLAMMTMAGSLSDHYGWLGMAGYAATGFPKVTRPTIVWWTHHQKPYSLHTILPSDYRLDHIIL